MRIKELGLILSLYCHTFWWEYDKMMAYIDSMEVGMDIANFVPFLFV